MIYADGNEAMLGDVVAIGVNFNGVVVTSIDNAQYSPVNRACLSPARPA